MKRSDPSPSEIHSEGTAIAPAPNRAAPTPQPTPVPLTHAPRVVAQLLHVAQSGGISRARITLHPQELGGVQVSLTTDASGGVKATVRTDTPQAAQVLQHAADDLRNSLERSGVTVSSIDIAQGDTTAAGSGGDGRQPRDRPQWSGPSGGAAADEPLVHTRTLTLPDGVLVDVLA